MGFNKLAVTSTYEHYPKEKIIPLTDNMLVKAGPKVQKKGNTMIKINVIKKDLEKAAADNENRRYNHLITAELIGLGLLIILAVAIG